MSVIDELVKNSEAYAAGFDKGDLPLPPAKRVAILACMDARLNPHALLGLAEGDAHVIRNAGGVVTDDEIRSLAISQRLLGTDEIMLIHHTDCGMLTFEDDDFRKSVEEDCGIKPGWAAEARRRHRARTDLLPRAGNCCSLLHSWTQPLQALSIRRASL
jgi:carbonic anhydrase